MFRSLEVGKYLVVFIFSLVYEIVFCVVLPDGSSRCLYLYFKIQLRDFCGSDLAEILVSADI